MYDRNNTGYYVDPASTSRLNYGVYDNLYSYGWMQSPIFYDANNTGYYVDPASTSKFNTINLGGVSKSSWPSGGSLSCWYQPVSSGGTGDGTCAAVGATCVAVEICCNYSRRCNDSLPGGWWPSARCCRIQ